MIRTSTIAVSILALAFCFVLLTPRADGGDKSDTKVKAAIAATRPGADGKQEVTITLEIEKDWFNYANPLGGNEVARELLESNATVVTFKAAGKLQSDVKYPKGKLKREEFGKDIAEYHIYQDRIVIEANVNRSAGDTSPLEVTIQVNSCKMGPKGNTLICLPTGKIVVKVR